MVRGALSKDVIFSRLGTQASLVFNDMGLALALCLYFPPLAFPLNGAGSLLLTQLFPLLTHPAHKLDLKGVTPTSGGLTIDSSVDAEQSHAIPEEDHLQMFPYHSHGEAERCVLRTPMVFVGLT